MCVSPYLIRFLPVTLFLFSAGLSGCGEREQEVDPFTEQIQQLNMDNRFEEALDVLREADQDEETIQQLQIATHMNYALYLTHEADHLQMTERMPEALRHFRRVIELDPGNERARMEINQIESIYQSLDREIPDGVAS